MCECVDMCEWMEIQKTKNKKTKKHFFNENGFKKNNHDLQPY
jgi:hypothetical protein